MMPNKKTVVGDKIKIQLKNIGKTFYLGKDSANDVKVVAGIDLIIYEGDFVIICGPSGSGKSTILNILIGLETPTTGKVYHDDIDIYKLKQDKRAKLRLKNIGVVLQQSIWLKNLKMLENVAIPHFLLGYGYRNSMDKAMVALKKLNMGEYSKRLPSELSGGQQQKIAIARALINNPDVIIADEPTGNLDTESSRVLVDELLVLNKKFNKTVIIVTHNLSLLKVADKNYYVKDGNIFRINCAAKDVPDSISKIEEMIK